MAVLRVHDPTGTVLSVVPPAGNWHEWDEGQRRFAARLGRISGDLARGLGLAAQRREAEALLSLIEQLEDAEARLCAE